MTISFEQARDLAFKRNAPAWKDLGRRGRYMVAPWGYEDDDAYLIVDGAAELLVDHDYSFEISDQPLTLVMKATGEVLHIQYLEAEARVDAMTDVGETPDDLEG